MALEFYLNKTVMKPADHSPLYVSLHSYLTQLPSCQALFPGSATSAATLPLPPSKCGSSSLNLSAFHLTGSSSWYQELSGSPVPPSLLSAPMLCRWCVQQTTEGHSESSSFQLWVSLEGLAQTQQSARGSGSAVHIGHSLGKPLAFLYAWTFS